jgi:hypothetical protein
MEVTAEDLNYPPYFGRNGRVFHKDVKENTKLFVKEFKETEFGVKLVSEDLAFGANLDLILEAAQAQFGHDDVNMEEYLQAAKNLWMLGDLKPKPVPVAQPPASNPLSSSQLAWQEYRIFTDSHSVAECKARTSREEGYRKFLSVNLERETMQSPRLELQPLNQKISTKKAVPADVAAYAARYRTMSSDAVRNELSPGRNPSGPVAAAEANRLFELCCQYGLI